MNDKRYVIGMDGGGTKTAAMIADLNGNILSEIVGGPANFQVIGVETVANTVIDLITQCCESVGCRYENIIAVMLGFAGAGRPVDQKRMHDGLRAVAAQKQIHLKKVIVDSDARIALEGAFRGDAGMILIAGTGSIMFGKDANGNIHRVGGWGRFLGDEGSGYSIGREGLVAVVRHYDGRGKATLLTKLVAEQFHLTDQTIVAEVYKNNFDIASIAPLVFQAAEQGDAVCNAIVNKAVDELLLHIKAMLLKINVAGTVKLAFIGGLLTHENMLSRMLRKKIEEVAQTAPFGATKALIRLQEPECSPVYGAVLMALKEVKVKEL